MENDQVWQKFLDLPDEDFARKRDPQDVYKEHANRKKVRKEISRMCQKQFALDKKEESGE